MHNIMKLEQYYKIITEYLEWLESTFGILATESIKNNISPFLITKDFLNNPQRKSNVQKDLPLICDTINTFWRTYGDSILELGKNMSGFKARFGGDIGPQYEDKIFNKAGLYFDTIIVPDPLLRCANLPPIFKDKEYYIIKYAINQILMKDIFISRTEQPIAMLVPDSELSKSEQDFTLLKNLAEIDVIIIVNKLFEQQLNTIEEVEKFLAKFDDIKEVIYECKDENILYWDEDVPRDKDAQLNSLIEYRNHFYNDESKMPFSSRDPRSLMFVLVGRMMQINDVFRNSIETNSHPLISAPVSFHWLNTKIEFNQEILNQKLDLQKIQTISITNSILDQKLNWFSNITDDNLIYLREKGYLSEIRELISNELAKFQDINIYNYNNLAREIDYNLSNEFKKHQSEISSLDQHFTQMLAIEGTTCLASVVAAIQPAFLTFLPDVITYSIGIIGAAKLKDIINSTVNYLREKKRLHNTPIGILWQAKNKG